MGQETLRVVGGDISSEAKYTVDGVSIIVENLLPVLGIDLVNHAHLLIVQAESSVFREVS